MTIDRTTFDAPLQAGPRSGPRAYVAVASGSAEPAVVDLLRGAEINIGRSRSSAIRVEDGAVSRTHASLRWDGGGTVALTDYGSRNGTLVDGRRVRGTGAIRSGAEIQVGDARFVLVIGGGTARASTGLPSAVDDEQLLATDPVMLRALALAERAALGDSTVLLSGETGVGKEVVAQRIHRLGARREGPFLAVNCGAIPENVAGSMLFGHEGGAFTGATGRQVGVFEAARGGTLFLDEVGELSSGSQAQLLRALEQRSIVRIGGVEEIPVDVRLVTATNRDLAEAVARGGFRQDLFYRLDVLRIHIPPLRERLDDVIPLALRFLQELAPGRALHLSPDAVAALTSHAWPGNVREVRNVIERAVAVCVSDVIQSGDLGDLGGSAGGAPAPALQRKVDDAEREAILAALSACGGNQTQAAKRLGISRRALIYRLEKLGLKAPPPSQRG